MNECKKEKRGALSDNKLIGDFKTKEQYQSNYLFELTEDEYRNILIKDRLKKKNEIKKTGGGYGIKTDIRDKEGDGIELLTGYNLSNVWSKITHQAAKIYPFSIKLPKQKRSNLAVSYSRTNLTEIERIIMTYMRQGDFFLENCCGWSTFSTSAAFFGYNGIGVDIWDKALEYSKKQYNEIKHLPNIGEYKIIEADGMQLPFNDEEFDYVYCNPPFMDIELYSGKENDVANSDMNIFLSNLKRILNENKRVLKTGNLCTMTINDRREDGILIPYGMMLVNCGLDVGFKLHDIVIAENPTGGSMIMRKREYNARRTAKMSEYVITFIKL